MKIKIAIATILLAFMASCRSYYTCPTYATQEGEPKEDTLKMQQKLADPTPVENIGRSEE